MKFINSKTEDDYRSQLIHSREAIIKNKKLLIIIKKYYQTVKTCYILNWFPDQGEEYYKLLINDSSIMNIEISRFEDNIEPVVEIKSVNEYKNGLKKNSQIKLFIAIELAKNDMKENLCI